jgi:hypothetical protein
MYDVMCYDDGGPVSSLVYHCADAFPLPYECGSDDYFAPHPVTGSYLATHWNVYDSQFLCPVATCIKGLSTGPAPDPAPTTPPPSPVPPAPDDPGSAVGDEAVVWLNGFLKDSATRVRRVGLRGLSRGQAVSLRRATPEGYSVQVNLMWGAAAIAGGTLDASGAAKLKVPRVHRALLSHRRSVRLVLQGVIRTAAGGGPPELRKVAVTLKAPKPKRKRRR